MLEHSNRRRKMFSNFRDNLCNLFYAYKIRKYVFKILLNIVS